jgi:hypothetical protein
LPRTLDLDLGDNVEMKVVGIKSGKLRMGSPPSDEELSDDEWQHEMEITCQTPATPHEFFDGTGAMKIMKPDRLWVKLHRRPAGSFRLEVNAHLNAVGDSDEGNAAVHPEVLSVEGHCPSYQA